MKAKRGHKPYCKNDKLWPKMEAVLKALDELGDRVPDCREKQCRFWTAKIGCRVTGYCELYYHLQKDARLRTKVLEIIMRYKRDKYPWRKKREKEKEA